MQRQRITKTLAFIIYRDGSARCPQRSQLAQEPAVMLSKLLKAPPTNSDPHSGMNCVMPGNVGPLLCCLLRNSLKPHQMACSHDLSANCAVNASSFIWARNSFALAIKAAQTRECLQKLSRADHRRCMATMAYIQLVQSHLVLVVHKSIAFEIGFRYLEGAIAVGCISFRHQLVLPDCCMVQCSDTWDVMW